MMAKFKCNNCEYEKKVPDEYIGKKAKCPNCKNSVIIENDFKNENNQIIFKCYQCDYTTKISNKYLGKSVKCPKCKEIITVNNNEIDSDEDNYHKIISLTNELNELKEDFNSKFKLLSDELCDLKKYFETKSYVQKNSEEVYLGSSSADEHINEQKEFVEIHDWLENKSISVSEYRQAEPTDEIYDKIALTLGDEYDILSGIYDTIKKNLSGNNFSYSLSSKNQDEINKITSFAQELCKKGFLKSNYKPENPYNRNSRAILAAPIKIGNFINFITGTWFERYIYRKINSFLSKNSINYSNILNAKICFPNKDIYEIDMLFIIGNLPLYIECTTGNWADHIIGQSEKRKLLSIPKDRSILVVLGCPDQQTSELSLLHDVIVSNQNNILNKVCAALGIDDFNNSANDEQSQSLSSAQSIEPSYIFTLLNKSNLRPFPEYRKNIIKHLINIVNSSEKPNIMADMKHILAEKIQISKSITQDILNAIVRIGCVLDEDNVPVYSFTIPFCKLISLDAEVIEEKCIENYAYTLLKTDGNFFSNNKNIKGFEEVVGGNAPSPDVIEQLKKRG